MPIVPATVPLAGQRALPELNGIDCDGTVSVESDAGRVPTEFSVATSPLYRQVIPDMMN